MKKSLPSGAAVLAVIAGLCSTVGCSSGPAEEETEKASSSEDALGQDPANCVFHHRLRRWNTVCTYEAPPTPEQRDQVNDFLTHASGIGSCAGVVLSIGALVGGTMTVVMAPASLAAAGVAVASAAGCGQYIGNQLRALLAGWSCTSFEVTIANDARERYDTCAMACGGSERLDQGNCYCGRTPLACQDAPQPTGTPPACGNTSTSDGCWNTSACPVTSAGRANCYGAANTQQGVTMFNVEGTKVYKCTAQGWRACN
jgi:hypothetical protein